VPAHKLLHQHRFADASLPADQHRAAIARCGGAQERRQLIETVIAFEKVHRASSALSRHLPKERSLEKENKQVTL
jgi:hypothetical protein